MAKAIVVISGKGGVGKSLVTSTLVNTLLEQKFKVAAIDADTDNPHLADFLNIKGEIDIKVENNERRLVPVTRDGLKVFSTSLIAEGSPIGLLGSTSGDLVNDVISFGVWEDVDYYCIDLPAGAGDEMRASFKALANILVGCVVVAQPAHLKSAERILKLLLLNEIPILGVIENMSYYQQGGATTKCKKCGKVSKNEKLYLFGEPGAEELSKKYGVEFLGNIPIVPILRDNGGSRLPKNADKPVLTGAQKAINSAVTVPGFITRAKERVKKITRNTLGPIMVDLWTHINNEIPVGELQEKYQYAGGRLIRMHLLDDDSQIIATEHFRVSNGKLVWERMTKDNQQKMNDEIENTGVRIFAKVRALAEAFSGKRVLNNGMEVEYTMRTAVLNGDIVPVGKPGDMIQAVGFLTGVYEHLKQRPPQFMIDFVKRLM